MDTVFQKWPDKFNAKLDNHIFISVSNVLGDAALGPFCLCCSTCCPPGHPSPCHQGYFPVTQILTCTGLFCYAVSGAGPLLNFIQFFLAHSSRLAKFLCKMPVPSEVGREEAM